MARIYSVLPRAVATTGGVTVTVRGSGFGVDPRGVEVEVGGVRAASVRFLDPTSGPSDTMIVRIPQLTMPLDTSNQRSN